MHQIFGQLTFAKETCVSLGSLESGKLLSISLYCLTMPVRRFASVSSTVMLSSTYTVYADAVNMLLTEMNGASPLQTRACVKIFKTYAVRPVQGALSL